MLEENIPLGDIPSRTDHDIPPKPIGPERKPENLEPGSDAAKAWSAEFRAFKEALTRHHRIQQRNMVSFGGTTCITIVCLDSLEAHRYVFGLLL